ncbi:3984_t:CDS:1, partial [Racocetra persica]
FPALKSLSGIFSFVGTIQRMLGNGIKTIHQKCIIFVPFYTYKQLLSERSLNNVDKLEQKQ